MDWNRVKELVAQVNGTKGKWVGEKDVLEEFWLHYKEE